MDRLIYIEKYDLYTVPKGDEGEEVIRDQFCEVITTSYQTGAEYRLVRNWDGSPSSIGAIRPRREHPENGKWLITKPYIRLGY